MLSFSNTTITGDSRPLTAGSLIVPGGSTGIMAWCPTARDLTNADGHNTIALEAARTSTTCFMVGLSERIRIQTATGSPWMWRRICFRLRGPNPFHYAQSEDAPAIPYSDFLETSNGFQRVLLNQSVNTMTETSNAQQALLFKGQEGIDWSDILTAPVDTRRVDLSYDKYRKISSGNASGVLREFNLWHRMKKNIVYDDDENGGGEATSYYSVDSKPGMGDFIVYDIFVPGMGSTAGDALSFNTTSSLYWHEK